MKRKTVTFLLFVVMAVGTQAEETSFPAFQEGTNFGNTHTNQVSDGVKQFNPQQVPSFTTSNPPETAYHAGNLSDSAAQMSAQSDLAKNLRQNYQNRPPGMVRKQEAWLQKGITLEQSDNPVQTLTGHYSDCKTTTPVTTSQYQILTCDECVGGEEKTCSIGQIVEVDAKHTYQCQFTRQREKLTCQKILNIQLQESVMQTPSCVSGSVIASGKRRILSATVFCEIDNPILTMEFVFGVEQIHAKRAIRVNGTGSLSFSHTTQHGWGTIGPLPYSLMCDAKEQCRFILAAPLSDSPISLSFERPRTKSVIQRIPVDSWDNQCATLEGRMTGGMPCRKLRETCVEGPATKMIQGVSVTRPCWRYQAEFECATNTYQNLCAALEAHPKCTLSNQTCVETDSDGVCRLWQKSFVCGELMGQREGVVLLNSSYTIVKDAQDTKACDSLVQNSNCTVTKETCVEGEATRIINGKPIHKTCWRTERTYACLGQTQSDCHEIPSNCTKIKSTCLSFDDQNPNRCLAWEHQYRCPDANATQPPVTLDCSGQKFCVNGNCYDTGYSNSPDFAKAVSQLSVLKDMQNKFDPNSLSVFKGTQNDCRKWPLNAMNCCSNKGWAIDRLASCHDNEKQLHQQQQEELVHEVGSYCSKKIFRKICAEKKRSFCVFDSKLARIIHEQGRGQIGLSWGEPESPNCRGFTPQELQRLHFEQMNLSEYYQDIWRQTRAPNQTSLSQRILERVQSYYSQGVSHAQ